jgi:hypothetical protein
VADSLVSFFGEQRPAFAGLREEAFIAGGLSVVAELEDGVFAEVVVEQFVPTPVVVVNREDQFGLAVIVIVPGVNQPHV